MQCDKQLIVAMTTVNSINLLHQCTHIHYEGKFQQAISIELWHLIMVEVAV